MDYARFDSDRVQQARLIGEPIHDGLARADMRSSCVYCDKPISWVPYRGAGCQTIHEGCYQQARGMSRPGRFAVGVVACREVLK